MRILLTGGGGMVGQNIQAFAKNNTDHHIDAPSHAELDLLNAELVTTYLHDTKPDLVLHAAGKVGGIKANMEAQYDFCMQNLQMGMNVIQGAYAAGVTHLLNIGSSCMYPRAALNPIKESMLLTGELEPTNEGYAIAKIAVAKLAQFLSQQHHVAYKTIIPCNLYGFWDKFDEHNAHMLPAAIRKIQDAKQQSQSSVTIWGDGTARREFMFAQDLADFIFTVIEHLEQMPMQFNIGVGCDYSINEYYQAVKEVLGYTGEFIHDLSKPTGMKQKLVDTSFQNSLGWRPKTNLKEGISLTYQYFLKKVMEPCYL